MDIVEIVKELESARSREALIAATRGFDARVWRGFVVGLSDDWVLLHLLSGPTMKLNGYVALRTADLTEIEDDESFAPLALKLSGERPKEQLDLLLLDLPGILSSATPLFPLLGIFREKLASGGCYIGKVGRLSRKKLTLRVVNRGGEWVEKPYRFRYKDITRIDLGDGYLGALWLVARRTHREAR